MSTEGKSVTRETTLPDELERQLHDLQVRIEKHHLRLSHLEDDNAGAREEAALMADTIRRVDAVLPLVLAALKARG